MENYTEAIEAFQKAELLAGGKKEVAKNNYDDLRNAYEKSGQDGYWRQKLAFAQNENRNALEMARLYAHLGDTEMAFDQLDKAFREKSEFLLWLNVDPGWDNICSEQRFVGLLRKIGLVTGD
jgi:tetratricopeptide (TPR) repeat protein